MMHSNQNVTNIRCNVMKNFLEFWIEDDDNLIKIIDLLMQLFYAFDNTMLNNFLMISQNGYLNFLIRKIMSAYKYIYIYKYCV